MAKVLISYSRHSREIAETLAADIEALGHTAWFDQELSGGQVWWDKILETVRGCEVFVFVLDQASLDSTACKREYGYAAALGKPILPVLVSNEVAMNLLPPALSQIQYVDYRTPDRDATLRLGRAFGAVPPPKPLPAPLPPPPDVPLSYLGALAVQVETEAVLSFDQQSGLIIELKRGLSDPATIADTRKLLARLKQRPDLLAQVDKEIDELLARPRAGRSGAGPAETIGEPPEVVREPFAPRIESMPASPRAEAPTSRRAALRVAVVVLVALALAVAAWIIFHPRPPDRGSFSVSSTPSRAAVIVDREPAIGWTPLSHVAVEPGAHKVILRLAQHGDVEGPFVAKAGIDTDLGVIALPPWPVLDLRGLGTEVKATVDGTAADGVLPVAPGMHRIELKRTGYAAQAIDRDCALGETVRPDVVPWPQFQARLDLSDLPSDAVADVESPDDRPAAGVLGFISSKNVTVVVTRPGYKPQRVTATVELGKTVRAKLDPWIPIPVSGTLDLSGFGAEARFEVDDRPYADGNPLAPGQHTLIATRVGFERQRHVIEVRLGDRVRVRPGVWTPIATPRPRVLEIKISAVSWTLTADPKPARGANWQQYRLQGPWRKEDKSYGAAKFVVRSSREANSNEVAFGLAVSNGAKGGSSYDISLPLWRGVVNEEDLRNVTVTVSYAGQVVMSPDAADKGIGFQCTFELSDYASPGTAAVVVDCDCTDLIIRLKCRFEVTTAVRR